MVYASDSLPPVVATIEEAYQACARLARSHYENFPVASRWIPADLRPAVATVYAFARFADDFADEPGLDAPARLVLLQDWRRRLAAGPEGHERHPVFWALSDVISRHSLPRVPFEKLITAFEMDVRTTRHGTFDDLLYYCRHSANPVGEILLRLFGGWTDARGRWSDAVCTGLQLANFWQDVTVDAGKDRIYIPLEDMAVFGVTEDGVLRGPATEPLKKMIACQVARTWDFFNEGRPLLSDSPSALRKELRLVWLGGTEILRKIQAQNFDVWLMRPHLSKWDWVRIFGKLLAGAPGGK